VQLFHRRLGQGSYPSIWGRRALLGRGNGVAGCAGITSLTGLVGILDSAHESGSGLGPRKRAWLDGINMRLHDDVRKLVVFLGARTTDIDGVIVPLFAGTGFFVSYPAPSHLPSLRFSYLVTARHVAEALVGPFVIGINNSSGELEICDIDQAMWQYHWDHSIDVAVVEINVTEVDWQPFPFESFADHENSALFSRFGVGDLVYIVGLYRLFPGKTTIFSDSPHWSCRHDSK
jgi:hypothetical protein